MPTDPTEKKRGTVPAFRKRKHDGGPPLVVLTAYDAPSAMTAEAAGVDALLVGDSLGNVLLGHANTLPVTLEDMLHHARAVGRVRRHALLIGDMPWMTYHLEPFEAVRNAARFVREAGCDAVKVEGGRKRIPAIKAILDAEIPVMGHIGLTPQSVLAMGGFRVQGRDASAADDLVDEARALAHAGVFGLVLEGIPAELAKRITAEIAVPTIGIGAGPHCDGQVLVYHDVLGMLPQRSPKFVRRYASVYDDSVTALESWVRDVRDGVFPAEDETY